MTRDEAVKIIEAYDALVERALRVTSAPPFHSSVDVSDKPRLSVVDDRIVLSWREYDSDYYGGGYDSDENTSFPIEYILVSDEQLEAFQAKVARDERERAAKVREAQLAVDRDRMEAHDRAEWERLRRKFFGK